MRQEAQDDNGQRMYDAPPETEIRPPRPTERSLGSLLVELTRELNDLFLTEVELTRTEVSSKIEQAATGMMTVLIGGLVAAAGLMSLVAAAVIAVNDYWLNDWALSALVVGVGVMVLGIVLAMIGKNRIETRSLVPERAARNVREDVRFLKEEFDRRV